MGATLSHMPNPGAPAANAGPTEIASVAGHALNNVLAYLFAASSYLDDGEIDAARARAAVDDACRGARALSSALSVLAMSPENLAGVPAFGQVIDGTGLARALGTVREIAGTRDEEASVSLMPHASTLDADTLEALMICAAFALRRSGGAAATLQGEIDVRPGPDDRLSRLSIRFAARLASGLPAPRRTGHGPCELALSHAAGLLPRLGAAIEQDADGSITLVVDLRPMAAVGGRDGR